MNFRVEYCMVTMIFTWIIYLLEASNDIYKYQGRQFLTVYHLSERWYENGYKTSGRFYNRQRLTSKYVNYIFY